MSAGRSLAGGLTTNGGGLYSKHVPAAAVLQTIALTVPLSRTLINMGTFDGACEPGDEYDPVRARRAVGTGARASSSQGSRY